MKITLAEVWRTILVWQQVKIFFFVWQKMFILLHFYSLVSYVLNKGEPQLHTRSEVTCILDTDLSKFCLVHQTCHPARWEDFGNEGEFNLIPVPVYSPTQNRVYSAVISFLISMKQEQQLKVSISPEMFSFILLILQ